MEAELLENLCHLARLRLDASEKAAFAQKFGRLLEFVEHIQAAHLEIGAVAEGPELTLRRDVERDFDWPSGTTHDFRVPKVIDFEGEG